MVNKLPPAPQVSEGKYYKVEVECHLQCCSAKCTQRLKCLNLVCRVHLPSVQQSAAKVVQYKMPEAERLSTVLSLDPTMAAAVLLLALLPLALADPGLLLGRSTLGLHPTGVSYSDRSAQGLQVHPVLGHAVHGYGKREAEPYYGYNALAFHAYGGVSSEARSAQGANYGIGFYGKREAEPYYGYGSLLGSASVSRSQIDRGSFFGTGPAAYNYGFNIRGKRSADASYGYGSLLGSATVTRSQVDRGSFYGNGPAAYNYGFSIYGKRSAEPFYGYGTGVSHQVVSRPFSHYRVSQAHPY